MPLLPGKKNIGKNIKTELAAGKKPAQAKAIALNVARKSEKAPDKEHAALARKRARGEQPRFKVVRPATPAKPRKAY
jgi:hypothetical protein